MADLEFYKLSMTGKEADSGIRTGMEAGASSGVLMGDGNGGVSAATPGRDFGYPLLTGNGPPTGNTAANIGQHYFDMQATQAPYEYICVGLNAKGFVWIVYGDTGDGFKISGYFISLEALEAAISAGTVAAPTVGTAYGIGEAAPYDIYVWDAINSTWVNNGPLGGAGGGSGVPPHGDAGQVLKKLSDVDYDAGWGDAVPDGSVTNAKLANGSVTANKLASNSISGALGFNPGMVNPNLLDNWYFGNPVNQRGFTSYNGSDTRTYTIDRWWTLGQNTRLTLTDEGMEISVVNQGVGGWIYENIENDEELMGKEVTISALCVGNILLAGTFTTPDEYNTEFTRQFYEATGTYAVSVDISGGDFRFRIWQKGTTPATVIACKLELGGVQTLARQVNGEWVLNEIPNYGEQLRKCQRYLVKLDNNWRIRCVDILADYIRFAIPLPQNMRATPSIINTKNLYVRTPQLTVTGSDFTFSVEAFWGNTALIRAAKSAHGFTDAVLVINNGEAFLSNDL